MIGFINFQDILKLILPILLVSCSFILGIIFENYVIKKIKKSAQKTPWKYPLIILESLQGFSLIWFILGGVFCALEFFPLNAILTIIIQKLLLATFLISLTLFITQFSIRFLRVYTRTDEGISPLTSLFELLTKILIFSLGILIVLQSIGIPITPLLTALGVGGVSIGLALQTTLSNLMSGINIITSKKVKPGDYIQLKTGEAGYVVDVELKYTVIREITNNFLVIPNSHIIDSSFRNYSLPDKVMLIPVEVGINYESDLEQVEEVTIEVVKMTLQKFNNSVNDEQPLIRYNEFSYYSINLIIYLKVLEKDYFEHLLVKHEFLKSLHQRYQQEGIKLAFPISGTYLPSSESP